MRGIPGGEQCADTVCLLATSPEPLLVIAGHYFKQVQFGCLLAMHQENQSTTPAVVALLQTLSAAATPHPLAMAQRQTQPQHSGCSRWPGSTQRSCLDSGWPLTGTMHGSWGQAPLVWLVRQACLAAACLACTSRRPGMSVLVGLVEVAL